MKRFGVVVLLSVFAVSLSAQSLKDGKYFAQQDEFGSSGWKSQVVLEVKGGKITAANWNAVSTIAGAVDKKAYDKAGKYNMVKFGKAQAEWHEQAAKAQTALIAAQNPAKIAVKSDGKTDAISGVSISVDTFLQLATKALKAAK